jgi:hypothetical protein
MAAASEVRLPGLASVGQYGHCARLILSGLWLSSGHGRNLLSRDYGQVYTLRTMLQELV